MSNALTDAGFENVRVLYIENELFVSLEDNLFRWNVQGISSALDIISKSVCKGENLNLYLLKRGIPQIILQVSLDKWQQYKKGLITSTDIFKELQISYTLGKGWETIKKVPKTNKNIFKADVVVYPQFAMRSTNLSKLYEIQLNLAPALELSCWKGMKFTGQVILPIINQLSYEGDFVRPGFVTISQYFRLPQQWFGRVTIGNFNANRYGFDVNVNHYFLNNSWAVGFNSGLTGFSYFYKNVWLTSSINNFIWQAKAQYFNTRFNLQSNLICGKFINGDYGVRTDLTRHFGAISIGLFGTHSGGKSFGGFHFAIPLSPIKRDRHHHIRIVPPNYFDWEYNAGTEYYYGRYYETRPNENHSEHFLIPAYVRKKVLDKKLKSAYHEKEERANQKN